MVITLSATAGDDRDLAELAAALDRRWPPRGLALEEVPASIDVPLHIEIDGTGAVRVDGAPEGGGWDRVESILGLFAAEHLSERVAVHAAVLVADQGAIVLPGLTHSGKSTLARSARHRGLRVLGDEYALVDVASGTIQGWPRPLRHRTPAGVERTALDETEQASAFSDHPVRLVAALTYSSDPPAIEPASRSEMVMQVLLNTVCAQTRPEASFRAAMAMTAKALLLAGRRGESEPTLDLLLELLDAPS